MRYVMLGETDEFRSDTPLMPKAEQFEKPETHYPGVYFYARRSYYPKPFKGLVQKA